MIARNRSRNVNELTMIFLKGLLRLQFLRIGNFLVQDFIIAFDLKTGKRVLLSDN